MCEKRNNLKKASLYVFAALMMTLGLAGCKKDSDGAVAVGGGYAIERKYPQGPVTVRLRVDKESMTLSQLLLLELESEAPQGNEVSFPDLAENLDKFEVWQSDELSEKLGDGDIVIKTKRYRLEPLQMGQCGIGELDFEFEGQGKSGTVTTEPVYIEVGTILPADPNNLAIAEIEDVVEVRTDLKWWWVGGGIAVVVIAAAVLLYANRPRRKTAVKRVYRPAHDIAYDMLRAIAKEKLVEQGRVKEFYEKLSGCLRRYIENRFQLRAPEQTTEEFLEQLKNSDDLPLEYKQQLAKFLEHCDLVKFARYQPSGEQINESLNMAERFVDKTKSPEHVVDVTDQGGDQKEAL